MGRQLDIFSDAIVHTRENNIRSEENLVSNYEHFSKQCQRVFNLLMNGKVLTTENAVIAYKIRSLPRRILDLKTKGVTVNDEWDDSGKCKRWFMTEGTRFFNQKFLEQ